MRTLSIYSPVLRLDKTNVEDAYIKNTIANILLGKLTEDINASGKILEQLINSGCIHKNQPISNLTQSEIKDLSIIACIKALKN